MPRILIVEDDRTFATFLESFLSGKGYQVISRHTCREARSFLSAEHVDFILLDYRLPDGTGLDILDTLNEMTRKIPVLIMTSFHDIRTAVAAMKKGARDFITKPVNSEELLMLIRESISDQKPAITTTQEAPEFISGQSEAAQLLEKHLRLVADTDMSVLIEGESGTGKEHAARKLHLLSKRAQKPFIAIDCGTLTAELATSELFGHKKGAFTGALQDKVGQFEYASGGTIFFDEVGNLPYDVQVKLLRALQEKEITPVGSNTRRKFDVRIVSATNETLLQAISEGKFREDLYHRLNEFKITMPSLKERGADLNEFIRFFIDLANRELNRKVTGLSPEVKNLFERYHWPGNVRELKNILKRAVLLSDGPVLTMESLPAEMELSVSLQEESPDPSSDLKIIQEQTERTLILKALQEEKFNKSKAARRLNIDRTTLYAKMKKYGIED